MSVGLYVHIPFCVRKCRYCDFVSFSSDTETHGKYLTALKSEAEKYIRTEIDTIFLGGGTPSVLSAESLCELFDIIRGNFKIAKDAEFTVEVNPGTLTEDKAAALKAGGVNRISMGVQSFNDAELETLGRIHSAKTAKDSVLALKDAGFKNINIDLMTSIPRQTPESLFKTIECAVSLPVTHISAYSLILEENTPLYADYKNGRFTLPDDDTDRDAFASLVEILKEHGFERYEISNFSKRGFKCRHNIKYWQCREYIGLGLAAHSYLNGRRFFNTSDLKEYLSGNFRTDSETVLTRDDMMSEFMMLGFRMTDGIDPAEFMRRFGTPVTSVYGELIEKFLNCGLMQKKNGKYSLTSRGLDVSNSIMCEFML